MQVDDIDRLIVTALVKNGRLPVRTLADEVHISRSSLYKRMSKLTESGAIKGFSAIVDFAALGQPITALVLAKVDHRRWQEVLEMVPKLHGIRYVSLTSGEFDALFVVRVETVERLRELLLERLPAITAIESSTSVLVLHEVSIPPSFA